MIRKLAVICILALLAASANAQYASRLGRFQVDQVRGCAPFTVNVTILAPFVCDATNPCDMDFEGNNNYQSLTFTHTYSQPGNYTLGILFQTTGLDDIPIEVVPSAQPQFDLYTCGNNEVAVQLNDSNYDEYVINYNDGSPEAVVSGTGSNQHVYAPGTQTVAVRGRNANSADNCAVASQVVTPLMSLPAPTITQLEVLDNSSIRLDFNALPNIQYKLGIATNGATTFQQAGTIYNTTTHTIGNLRTDDNFYCFQLAAFDPCNNVVINSAVICSQNFDINFRNKAIDATWTTSTTGITGYSLIRTATDGSTFVTSPAGSPYTDVDITCGIQYCYRLTSEYGNGSRSISVEKCGEGLSTDTPTGVNNISTVIGDNAVALEWQSDPAFPTAGYTLLRSVDGAYADLSTLSRNTYVDEEFTLEQTFCYRVNYVDLCGNNSAQGVEACPIVLTTKLQDDNSVSLSWNDYAGWIEGVSTYIVEKYADDGTLMASFDAGTSTSYVDVSTDVDQQVFIYRIQAVPVAIDVPPSLSNRVIIYKDPNLFHPTAFTPNGDNLNDVFTVFGQYVAEFELLIFNRWGELLFTTRDMTSGWDGTYKGKEMPEGSYTFVANITDRAGRTFKRSGSVLLLRK